MDSSGQKIILASGSPRRYELLKQIGLAFDVVVRPVDERIQPGTDPGEAVMELAFRKAAQVALENPDSIVIGADTVVVKDKSILGKPADSEEAFQMLQDLNNSSHSVITGYCILYQASNRVIKGCECTNVLFRNLDTEEIKSYVDSGEPMDKAGAYGIQGLGSVLIHRIEGCYFNVVGLPLTKLTLDLKKLGVKVLG